MQKFVFFVISLFGICFTSYSVNSFLNNFLNRSTVQFENTLTNYDIQKKDKNIDSYNVFVDEKLKQSFYIYKDALFFAKQFDNSYIKKQDSTEILWDNFMPYFVYLDKYTYYQFENYVDAVNFAKNKINSFVYYRKNNSLVWTNFYELKNFHKIQNVPQILQLPELARGCEVTSLCMLINFKGVNIDKMVLAQQLKKDNTIYQIINGYVYYGNPNNGFVGNMYSFEGNGLGVYHKPVYELLCKYFPTSAIDVTGCDFEDILFFISNDMPVWIITNSAYKKLPPENFIKWNTTEGQIDITYKEHSVLITGYDDKYIYFNDPLGVKTQANRSKFVEAFIQMGSQALVISC